MRRSETRQVIAGAPACIDDPRCNPDQVLQQPPARGAAVAETQKPRYRSLEIERAAVGENLKDELPFAAVVAEHGDIPVPRVAHEADNRKMGVRRRQIAQVAMILKHPGSTNLVHDQLVEEGSAGARDVDIDEMVGNDHFTPRHTAMDAPSFACCGLFVAVQQLFTVNARASPYSR